MELAPGRAVFPLTQGPPVLTADARPPLHLSSLSAAGSLPLSGPCARICRLSSKHQHLRRAQVGPPLGHRGWSEDSIRPSLGTRLLLLLDAVPCNGEPVRPSPSQPELC